MASWRDATSEKQKLLLHFGIRTFWARRSITVKTGLQRK